MKKCKEFQISSSQDQIIVQYQDDTKINLNELPIDFECIGNFGYYYDYRENGHDYQINEPVNFDNEGKYIDTSLRWNFEKDGKLCPFRKNGKWGFVNAYFQIVIEAHFDYVGQDYDREKSCWQPPLYYHETQWNNGQCKVLQNGDYIIINENDYPSYFDSISNLRCKSIDDIIEWCHQSVPNEYKARPWTHPQLNHGVDLLASEDALNCYMSAYGDMHVGKCRAAMMTFPFDALNGTIEIVDWGCGQGIGSATVVDILKQRDKIQWLKRITLIEPSIHAIERAEINLSKLTGNTVEIDVKNTFLPSVNVSSNHCITSIGYTYANVIHIFSNILDVTSIDLGAVAKMVAASHGTHYIICIGPKNSAAYRIEKFCSVFGTQQYFSKIDSVRYALTKRTSHPFSCVTRCFVYDGSPLDLSRLSMYNEQTEDVYNDYDFQLQIQNGLLTKQKARVAWRLQNMLLNDEIMYINPVVNEVAVDFIIVRPNKGVVLVNVFEHNLDDCELSNKDKEIIVDNKKYQSPIDLISLCQTSLKDGIEELLMSTIENSRNFAMIKKVVVFTENKLECVRHFFNIEGEHLNFTYVFGSEFISDSRVSYSMYKTIGLNYNNSAFDDVVKRKIAKIISPSWHSYQEGKVGVEPKGSQKELAKSQKMQQKISGVAGSGKTHVLAIRAIDALKRTGGDILILTYNITLANYLKTRLSEIREDFSWEKIDIYPYHQFFRIRASEGQLHVNFNSYEDVDSFANSHHLKRYSAVFVDEVQDYTTEWLKIVMQSFLLEPNGEFVVFGDPKQNVYHRPLDANNDIRLGVIGGVWNKKLKTSLRFANPRLASLATAFQTTFLAQLPTDEIISEPQNNNIFDTNIVTYSDLRMSFSLDKIVSEIKYIMKGNQSHDFVVLASSNKLLRQIDYKYRQITNEKTEVTFVSTEKLNHLKQIHNVTDENTANWKFKRDFEAVERTRKQLFTTDKRCLKLSTIQSFKGWESRFVIVILESDYYIEGSSFRPAAPETIYTAITRAKERLYIINIGNSNYHNFFNAQAQ